MESVRSFLVFPIEWSGQSDGIILSVYMVGGFGNSVLKQRWEQNGCSIVVSSRINWSVPPGGICEGFCRSFESCPVLGVRIIKLQDNFFAVVMVADLSVRKTFESFFDLCRQFLLSQLLRSQYCCQLFRCDGIPEK